MDGVVVVVVAAFVACCEVDAIDSLSFFFPIAPTIPPLHNSTTWTRSVGALVVMTGISVLTGQIFHNVPTALTQV